MRAAWYERKGPAREVLEVGEMDTPEPGPGELRVRLAASGINPADVKLRAGINDYGFNFPRVIPNSDGAGTVDQVGAGVDPTWVGRRVWLYNGQRLGRAFGTAADYIALDAGLVHALPDKLGFAEGATLGIPAMTAHRCVFADGSVTGKTVLVTGGAGAVGHYAVQLAAWGGARVLATVSGEAKAAHALAGGAAAVVNYRQEDVARRVRELTDGEGVDRIVEVDFGGNLATAMGALKRSGTIAIYASDGNPQPQIDARALMALNATLRFVVLNSIPLEARRQAQRDVTRWALGGGLFPVAARFPLDEIVAAHELVESLDKLGTVVVEP
ncbi:MAG: NADPH:quinone reductase [Alphaproteobacteria bacterium]|nr:NADPH:quinone reductase [Alphaproteobacteria bacterium]